MKAMLTQRQRNALIEFITSVSTSVAIMFFLNSTLDVIFVLCNLELMDMMPVLQQKQLRNMAMTACFIALAGSMHDSKDYIYKDIL